MFLDPDAHYMTKLFTLLSWRNWGIIRYNSFWQNAATLFYIVLAGRLFNLAFIGRAGLFMLFSTLMTGYGYLINDLADIDLDRQHGKPNVFLSVPRSQALWIVLAVLGAGMLSAWSFLSQPWFIGIWLVWLLAATFYSLPPLRLKEHGFAGLMSTIAAQQTLPTALLFAVFGQLTSWDALIFVAFSTVRGISSDVGHQMRDWVHDATTGTLTFAVQRGYAAIQRIYAVNLEVERLMLGCVMALLLVRLPSFSLPWIGLPAPMAWPLVLFYMLLFSLTVGRSWRSLRQGCLAEDDPYDETLQARAHGALHTIHHSLPSVLVPLYLATWMTICYWPNIVFLLAMGLVYNLFSIKRWTTTWPIRLLLAWLQVGHKSSC